MKAYDKLIHLLNAVPIGCATALVFTIIVALTLMPGDDVPSVEIPYADKVVHFLMFGAFAAVLLADTARYKGYLSRQQWLICAVMSSVFGAGIEISQMMMGLGRAAEWADFAADSLGAFIFPLPFLGLCKSMATDYNISISDVRRGNLIPSATKRLYLESFPPDERRPWKSICEETDNRGRFHFSLIHYRRDLAGFISWWTLDEGIYVEHFAIDPSKRSHGLGAMALERFCTMHKTRTIVLEVEKPDANDMAMRRIGFYRRCGFTLHSDFHYIQPPYTSESQPVELLLMTSGPAPRLDILAAEIKQRVYKTS